MNATDRRRYPPGGMVAQNGLRKADVEAATAGGILGLEQAVNLPPGPPYLSTIDEERFGIRTARVQFITTESLGPVVEWCALNGM